MISRFKVAVAATLLFGSASAALAEEHFDINIYRPGGQSAAFAIYHGAPDAARSVRELGAYAQVPTRRAMQGPKSRMW